jgi:glycosyltransferase involved in cell wall biosynthesis
MTNQGKTIRIAHTLAGAPIGGAENFYTRLVCALAEDETSQQGVFTRPNERREHLFAQAGLPVSLHRLGGRLDILGRYQYRKALAQWRPDVVVTYMNRATMLTPKGDYKLIARLGHYYDLKYYKHCDYWIGITKGICRYMIEKGFPADRVFQIPNFVDEAVTEPLSRTSFNTPADVPLLLAAGRLHTNKGFDVLLKALVDIPDAVLWLAGDGPEADSLKSLSSELKVNNRVRFLGWRNDINALMRTADIFVCPSRHEGLGSIVPESWFNQCPIIATRSQGPEELIEDENTGLLVDIDDVEGLAIAINSVLKDKEKDKRLKRAGTEEYFSKYQKSIIVNQYTKIFNSLLAIKKKN